MQRNRFLGLLGLMVSLFLVVSACANSPTPSDTGGSALEELEALQNADGEIDVVLKLRRPLASSMQLAFTRLDWSNLYLEGETPKGRRVKGLVLPYLESQAFNLSNDSVGLHGKISSVQGKKVFLGFLKLGDITGEASHGETQLLSVIISDIDAIWQMPGSFSLKEDLNFQTGGESSDGQSLSFVGKGTGTGAALLGWIIIESSLPATFQTKTGQVTFSGGVETTPFGQIGVGEGQLSFSEGAQQAAQIIGILVGFREGD